MAKRGSSHHSNASCCGYLQTRGPQRSTTCALNIFSSNAEAVDSTLPTQVGLPNPCCKSAVLQERSTRLQEQNNPTLRGNQSHLRQAKKRAYGEKYATHPKQPAKQGNACNWLREEGKPPCTKTHQTLEVPLECPNTPSQANIPTTNSRRTSCASARAQPARVGSPASAAA